VIEDGIHDDGESAAVGFADQGFEIARSAIGGFGGEVEGGVVAPTFAAGEFIPGQGFDGSDAKVLYVVELFGDAGESIGGEVGDGEFVDDRLERAGR